MATFGDVTDLWRLKFDNNILNMAGTYKNTDYTEGFATPRKQWRFWGRELPTHPLQMHVMSGDH